MTAIERTAYPRFKQQLTRTELEAFYRPDEDEHIFVQSNANGQGPQLTLLLMLKTFQNMGYFPPLADSPDYIVDYMRATQDLPMDTSLTTNDATLTRYRRLIRKRLQVRRYREGGEEVAAAAVSKAAQTMNEPADLISVAVEELVKHRYQLPAFYRLDNLVASIRTMINETYHASVMDRLTNEDIRQLDALLTRHIGHFHTEYYQLKQPPGRAVFSQIRAHVRRLDYLERLLDTDHILADIPPTRVNGFADIARTIDASDLKSHTEPHRYTLLVSLLHHVKIQTRDDLVTMFIKRMRSIHKSAKRELAAIRADQQSQVDHLVGVLTRILTQAQQPLSGDELGQVVRAIFHEEGGIDTLLTWCRQIATYQGQNALPLMGKFYRQYRALLFDLVDLLDIRAASQDRRVLDALAFIQPHRKRRTRYLDPDISISFASRNWQKAILHRQDGQVFYNRRLLEICVFSYMTVQLLAGDLYVVGSYEYADPFAQLLSWEECLERLPDYCQRLGFPTTAHGFTQHLLEWLAETARQVDSIFPTEGQIYFKDDRPILRQLPRRQTPTGAESLKTALQELMPQMSVLDIIAYAERLVNFTRHFGPLSGSDPKLSEPVFTYIMTTFAYGSNLGPTQTARHSRGQITANDLSRANHRHYTADKLDAAQRDVIDMYSRLDVIRHWGSGRSSASDGTLINIYQNNLLSAYHLRYGDYGGVAYHHVSDTYIALFTHFISVGIWEAVYIIDGLLQNTSEIQPEMLHADTQGQSLPVFAFAYLLGIDLQPRIRNWKDLTLYRPTADAHYQHIDALFSDVADAALIESHWQLMMQVMISIEAGKVLPSTLLRRLGNYSRQNSLYRAFREVGRIVRTVFLLRYISDQAMRLQIRAVTNINESYHEFASWVSFGGHTLTTNDPIEQEKLTKYNQLVASCIILKNAIDISAILPQLARMGYTVNSKTIRTLSPYMTEHIRRFGEYVLKLDEIDVPPVNFEMRLDDLLLEDDSTSSTDGDE